MQDDPPFADLIRRVRGGDQEAAAEVVRRCEPQVRTRVRLSLLRLPAQFRRAFDSMDICQSVLLSFFVRAAAGQYDLDRPEQLVPLLVGMARNKLSEQVKHHRGRRRDILRVQSLGPEQGGVAAADDSPSAVVAGQELLQRARAMLSEEERQIADLRAEGLEWADVAVRLGGTSEGRRKQFARAIDCIMQELGLSE
jgi:RNA polymerase sigma-70 factor (ECF subfamily)